MLFKGRHGKLIEIFCSVDGILLHPNRSVPHHVDSDFRLPRFEEKVSALLLRNRCRKILYFSSLKRHELSEGGHDKRREPPGNMSLLCRQTTLSPVALKPIEGIREYDFYTLYFFLLKFAHRLPPNPCTYGTAHFAPFNR